MAIKQIGKFQVIVDMPLEDEVFDFIGNKEELSNEEIIELANKIGITQGFAKRAVESCLNGNYLIGIE